MSAVNLSVFKRIWCKMAEKMYPKGTSYGRSEMSAEPSGVIYSVVPLYPIKNRQSLRSVFYQLLV